MDWSTYKRVAQRVANATPLWTEEKIRARLVQVLEECKALHEAELPSLDCADEFFMKVARELPKLCQDADRLDATFTLLNKIWEELLINDYKELRHELVEWCDRPIPQQTGAIFTPTEDVGRVRRATS